MAELKTGANSGARYSQYAPPMPNMGAGINPLISLVRERRQHAVNRYTNFFRRVVRWYDLYRGLYSGKFQAFRNSVHIPFIFSVVQSDVAKKVQTSFGGWPIVEFEGYGEEDSGVASKNEVLISAQMKDSRSFQKAVDFYLSADMYGTGVAKVGWKQDIRKEPRRVILPTELGIPMERIVNDDVTHFEGPDWQVIDIIDFWIQPGKRCVEEADWVIHRSYVDYDEIVQLAKLGIFDMGAVRDLGQSPMPQAMATEFNERRSVYRSYGEFDAIRNEKFAKPVELWDMWGRVPSEFAPDGVTHRVVTVANGTKLLRNRPNPFWHGRIPFLAYNPMPDPHYFHGPGKVEIAEKMQYAVNRFANQKLDIIDLVADPVWLVNRQAGIDTQNLITRAGKVIGADGPVDDSVIRPLFPNLQGLQYTYTEIETLLRFIQQGTGIIEDTVQGAPASRRQTAREFLGRQESALTRLMLEARLAEEGFVEPLANMYRALNRQFLPVPKEVRVMGSRAAINPITGFPLPKEPVNISLEDVNQDYRARAIGATQMLSRSIRQQNAMVLLQAFSANPVFMKMVNWAAFGRQLFELFDFRNPDELLLKQEATVSEQPEGGEPSEDQMVDEALGQGDLPRDIAQNVQREMLGMMQ